MQRTAIELLIMGVLAIGLGIGWMAGRNAAGPGGLASVDPSLSPSVAPLEAAAADLAPPPLTAQERHDQALLDGLNRMAEGKPEEALKAFERARAALDTAQAAEEIAGARAQLERRKAEDEAAAAIRLALREGRGEEAAELADRSAERAAQHRPGGELAGLKKQAEALATVKLDAAGALTGTELARRLGPAFASRYELADGGAADVIAARLKMEPGSLDAHAAARQALARQARARFAVLGAFTRFPLLEVEARLVDLASGVVVQTAHVLARDDAGV